MSFEPISLCAQSDNSWMELSHQAIEQFAFLVCLLPVLLTHSEAPKAERSCIRCQQHYQKFKIICYNNLKYQKFDLSDSVP
jgi:hypothetical protein